VYLQRFSGQRDKPNLLRDNDFGVISGKKETKTAPEPVQKPDLMPSSLRCRLRPKQRGIAQCAPAVQVRDVKCRAEWSLRQGYSRLLVVMILM
jgi:hypothetical protein